jgi:hypothetical protein
VDVGFWSSRRNVFCGNRVFKMNIEFCCHLCCSSLWFSENVRQPLSLSFGFWPLFLSADDVFPWLVYAIIIGDCYSGYT